MKRLTIKFATGESIMIGVPDDASMSLAPSPNAPAGSQAPQYHGGQTAEPAAYQGHPQPSRGPSNSDDVRIRLYNELSAHCGGDRGRMMAVLKDVTMYNGKWKSVEDIPKMTDARVGVALDKLRKLVAKNGSQTAPQAPASGHEGFPYNPDDDIPF